MRRLDAARAAGFSLIEVLVTMVVVAVGLLGLAKMQAAALSNTQTARVRSLIALQADSLVAAMHSNQAYWASGAAPASWSAKGTQVTDPSGVLSNTSASCANTNQCDPSTLAAYDVQQWVQNMNTHFPSYAANVNCMTSAGAPVSCAITVSWNEKYVAINRSTAGSVSQQTSTQTFTLHVQP